MKRIFATLAILAALGCKVGHGSKANDATYRPTLHYVVTTSSAGLAGVPIPLLDARDLDSFQTQTGVTQAGGRGIAYVVVRDGGGNPQAGVTVEARNSLGLAIGSTYYSTATGFNGGAGTDGSGALVILNLDPGIYNIRAISSRSGNQLIDIEADGVTSVNLVTASGTGTVPLYGVTRSFVNPAGSAEPSVPLTGVGIASPFPVTSDGAGAYATVGSPLAVMVNNQLLIKASKSPSTTYLDTYNYVNMATAVMPRDLNIVTKAERDSGNDLVVAGVTVLAGKGIIRGKVVQGSGFTITASGFAGAGNISVAYGKGPSGAPDVAQTTAGVTDATGIFYVYNADPGTVFLRASASSQAGSTMAEAFADSVTFLDDAQLSVTSASQTNVIVSGTVLSFYFGAVDEATVSFLGTGASDSTGFSGDFSVNGVPSNSSLVIRTTK